MTLIYVNPITGQDRGNGTQNSPFKTITYALKRAISGSKIHLSTGIYHQDETFPLIIPTNVSLIGDPPTKGQSIIIDGTGNFSSPILKKTSITIRLEQNSLLTGVTISGAGTGALIESVNTTIQHNTFTACGKEGILVTGTAKSLIIDNLFRENGSHGITYTKHSKGEARRNLFHLMDIGIKLQDHSAPLLTDNNIINNRIGIHLSDQANPVLRQNQLEQNKSTGILISDRAQPDLGIEENPGHNILRNNGETDLENQTTQPIISAGNQLNPDRIKGSVNFINVKTANPIGPIRLIDVTGHWAANFILNLFNRNLISGFPDGTFKPNNNLTRAEFASLITRNFNIPPRRSPLKFTDVSDTFWAANAIKSATQMGFLSGFPDNSFRPSQNLTKAQAIVSLINGLQLTATHTTTVLSYYRDRSQIPSYAIEAIATATTKNMIVNYPDIQQLNPLKPITRGETAALLYQSLVILSRVPAIASPYIVKIPSSSPTLAAPPDQHWSAPYIKALADQELINQLPNNLIEPDKLITRAQYAILLVRAIQPTPKLPPTTFKDIPPDHTAIRSIEIATSSGFLIGDPAGLFRPDDHISKTEVIVSLVNGLELPPGKESTLDTYTDQHTIPFYARLPIASATEQQMIINHPNPQELNPNKQITQGEVIALIYMALVYLKQMPPINSSYQKG